MSTALELPTLGSLRQEQRKLKHQLSWLRRRMWLELGLELVAETAIILTVAAAVLVFLDYSLRLGRSTRLAVLAASLAAVGVLLAARAWQRRRALLLDDLSLAVVLDRFRPGTGQRVADVLQLPELLSEVTPTASPAMVRLAVQQASAALAESDWRSLWNTRRTALHAGALLLALLVSAASVIRAPETARLSIARWLHGSSERWPQRTYLTVMGLDRNGRLLAPRDEPLTLEVRADLPLFEKSGNLWRLLGRDEPLIVRRKPARPVAPDSVQIRERTADGKWREGTMTTIAPTRYHYELAPSAASSNFDLTGGDDWLGPIAIERVDRPALADIKLRVKEPGAAGNGFREIADPHQHLLLLADTEVELTLAGNQPLNSSRVKVNPGKTPELKRIDDRSFATRWTLREATTLEIVLTSSKTGLESRPAFLSLGLLRDREPRVTVRAQGVGGHVTPVATVPLSIAATDDFGLAALRLRIERTLPVDEPEQEPGRVPEAAPSEPKTQTTTVDLPLPLAGDRPVLDQQTRHDVTLQVDPPPVGTLIRIVGEAEDRCARGTQTGRSSVLALQVVSPDELFYEILIRQRAERAKFVAILESHEKQTGVFEGSTPPNSEDWVRLARHEHATSRQLDQIASRLADALQEMRLNQVGSPKSHRLLQDEVIDPIRALGVGPLNALRSAVQNLANSGQGSPESLDTARRLHHEVVTTMKTILAQMSQWESFVDVVNQVAEVIRMEQKILQETEKARESRAREVFDGKP